MSQNLFNKTLIIGLGLIGGSFAKALRNAKISKEIFAYDLDEESIDLAKSDGVIDRGVNDLNFFYDEFSSFDLIILATPLSSYAEIFSEITDKISSNSTVIDLGSVKDLKIKNLPKNFIPCHPIAGSENSGFEHSAADLFLDKKFIICPENTNPTSLKKVEEVIKKIGATVELLEAKKHDEIYALVSHLPQFLSFLTKEFSPKKVEGDFFKTAFRLDDSSPEVWEDIFEMNEKNLEKFYLKFFERLGKNIDSLQDGVCNPVLTFSSKLDDMNMWTGLQTPSSSRSNSSEEYFKQNFAEIFFRFLIVKSYLEIPEIKTFQTYVGSGFSDFTSIIQIANFDQKKLRELIKKNHAKILKLFDSIS